MTTPKEALERALEYLDGDSPMHSRGGHRNEVLRVEIRQALASLEGDAVERVARIIDPEAFEDDRLTWENRRVRALNRARAILAAGPVPDEAAIRAATFDPTDAQTNSACLSFRHDYGLLDDHDRERLRFVAVERLRAWQKEGFGCDRDEVIERCAAIVDQCNREGPYQAIASAKRIRALKSAAGRAALEQEGE